MSEPTEKNANKGRIISIMTEPVVLAVACEEVQIAELAGEEWAKSADKHYREIRDRLIAAEADDEDNLPLPENGTEVIELIRDLVGVTVRTKEALKDADLFEDLTPERIMEPEVAAVIEAVEIPESLKEIGIGNFDQ